MTPWPDNNTAVALRAKLAESLDPTGSSDWRLAFETVPRHLFVPRFLEQRDGTWEPVRWGDAGFLEAVYADDALTTQVDAHNLPTSSSSQPSVMLAMLDALDARPGDRVLELGTGTGYNLALLASRLGDQDLVSIEPDTGLVQDAITRLGQLGHRPRIVAGDGTLGYPNNAPYQRIIATFALPAGIPRALLDQLAPDGVIVAPLGHGIVRLVHHGDGHATGQFLPSDVRFMTARHTSPNGPALDAARQAPARTSTTTPESLFTDRIGFPLSLALPRHTTCSWKNPAGQIEAVAIWLPDGSTALADTDGTVRQTGPRRLWDIVEGLAQRLPQSVERHDVHLTVTPTEQTATHTPSGTHWPLAKH
ncbi:Protein-L-isoaspartate O-methyltransferase [Streptomyces sp. YIM 130001]|uniref:hypothetical protein n=1 Tax=Streptomyces sp. YIM 130001 TaxID=2259644 RepID=UPI000EC1CA36|nr:hypothetical protein [Streptomyces sp. YIM 130001]RII07983.1 Protein-L-isoaspartate O-methyltransferase [Streptomyces sp. YIM 130001]